MIIDFKFKNYRSFKEETTLSLEASGAKGKSDNVAHITTKNGKKFRLLKTAVIYGANASGKSNVMKAFWAFRQLITYSFKYDVNDDLKLAESFELDEESVGKPTEFSLNFIGWDMQQYIYFISFSKTEGIIEESLKYYLETQPKIIFKRKGRKLLIKNPDIFKDNQSEKVNPKRLYLSELGNSGDEFWEGMRNYFVKGTVAINGSTRGMMQTMSINAKRLFEKNDPLSLHIKDQVVRLIQLSDLGIQGLDLVEEEVMLKPSSENEDESTLERSSQRRFKTYHDVYRDNKVVDKRQFDLINQGSVGTSSLVGLSAEILLSLNSIKGRPIWIDEIDNSLHPYLCRFLINLFNHPTANPENSQLIFATHETTLLDRNNFRKDQIWITSKNRYGCSKLYSVYDLDIDGLRDDIPFEKWYMSGKFGGLPKIKEMDFIFEREKTKTNGKG